MKTSPSLCAALAPGLWALATALCAGCARDAAPDACADRRAALRFDILRPEQTPARTAAYSSIPAWGGEIGPIPSSCTSTSTNA